MTAAGASVLDPGRWQRLKAHVAELAELPAAARDAAVQRLELAADDRALLAQLLAQLDPDDARLATPVTTAAAEHGGLRWQAGAIVGAYAVDGFLGRGGMSEVYAAHERASGRPVALKILRQGLPEGGHADFSDNERRALRRLDDPRIARFIDSFAVPEMGLCLVLERVDGEPLDDWCEQRRADVDARLGLYLQICQAVASAHQQLVVHRDLKPDNVLVCADGRIKLLDFGVAKLLEDQSTSTHTHGGLYTLEFAAPEQVLRNPVSAATDVYALGVLLFRLLVRASPYAVGAGESLVKAVLSDRPRPLAEARAQAGQGKSGHAFDRDLDLVIGRAMEKDPRDRYRSVMELVADVQSIRAGMPIRAGGGRWYRLAKFVRRHPAGVAMSGALLLALLAATGVSLYWARQADAQARNAAADARRATAANEFLLAVLDLNDRFSRRNSGDLTLAQVLDRAVLLAGSELADEPEVRADVLSKLSVAMQRRGDTERALALAAEALEILERLPARDPQAHAAALRRVGSIEVDLNRLEPAQRHLAEAVRIMDGLPSDHRRLTISAMTSLARIASARGDPQSALRMYQSILRIRASLDGDNRADTAMDYSNLGAALLFLARFEEAATAYATAIELLRAVLGDSHPRLGLVRSGRAAALIQLGRLDEARRELVTAVQLMEAAGEPSGRNPYRTIAELNLASADYWAGDVAAALARMRAFEPRLPAAYVGSYRLWRGRVARAQGQAGEAAGYFRAAAAYFVESGGAAHPRRWLAHGLAAIAAAEADPVEVDGGALQEALDALAGADTAGSAERAELLLYAGAVARRGGDHALALERHRECAAILRRSGWMGEIGRALVEGESALDQLAGADGGQRAGVLAQLDRSIETLERLSPGNPQLQEFRAGRR